MILAIVIGEGSLICLPFIVGGIVERYELAEGAAGIITSLQFATMGLVSIAIFNIVHKIDRRRWLLIAAGFILLGHALAMLSSSWTIFLIGRVFTGLMWLRSGDDVGRPEEARSRHTWRANA